MSTRRGIVSRAFLAITIALAIACATAVYATSLSTVIGLTVKSTLAGGTTLAPATSGTSGTASISLPTGTGTGQADVLYAATITLSASANQSIDLAGSLTNPLGGAAVFAKVKAIYVKAASGNTNSVLVGGAGSNAFVGPFGAATDTVSVAPGDAFLVTKQGSGWTVTASTGDLLKVANSAGSTSVTFDIIVVGTSA